MPFKSIVNKLMYHIWNIVSNTFLDFSLSNRIDFCGEGHEGQQQKEAGLDEAHPIFLSISWTYGC